jgi:HK97 family phage major capsid protein
LKTLQVGSDPDGGYWVTPDVSGRIVRRVYETSPVRQNASVQSISTADALEGMEDLDEAAVGYAGEHSVSGVTTTPQIGQWRIPVYWIDTEPKTTQQILDDASVNVEAWLASKVSDKFGRFENSEFINGVNKVKGFVLGYTLALDSGSGVTWGTVGYMKTGVSSDFAATDPADDLVDLVGLLKNEYLANAKFYTRRSVITLIRKFKAETDHGYLWQPSFVAGMPEMIMGYPVVRMEDMPALANGSNSLVFGDLGQAYQIVDRQGMRVIRDNLTSKPYVKFYTSKRVGGGVVNFEAIKVLQFGA